MSPVAGVILAGGQSSRMGGGDKCLLTLGKQTLLGQVIERLAVQVSSIVLNANGDASRFSDYPLPVVEDSFGGFQGPLAGILAGMDWAAKAGHDQILTVSADTPFFPNDLLTKFQEEQETSGSPIVLAATPGEPRRKHRHPTFGLWDVALREDLRAALSSGVRKVVAWSDKHAGVEAEFPFVHDTDPFFNINTPEDMLAAKKMIEGMHL
ncbi:molybdopterin-guanine dinucleotide biosynthesis protein A [Rhodobacterales bacterium HTCC2150]|nr:molybdopterin-guanine dinucleotide biosynthesis protein A [Rhodobacterales bacterium HTCC2150] [Rhodobacteraceae bacterium HTCC2150]